MKSYVSRQQLIRLIWMACVFIVVGTCAFWTSLPGNHKLEDIVAADLQAKQKSPNANLIDWELPKTELGYDETEPSSIRSSITSTVPFTDRILRRCDRTAAERKAVLQDWCKRNDVVPRVLDITDYENIYVNEKHKVLYCRIPKTGCTNWKKYFVLLSGRTNYTAISQIKGESAHHGLFEENVRTLSTYKKQEIAHMLTDYYKFTIVRNPLTRLLSAYRNKFAKDNPVFRVIAKGILRHRHHNENEDLSQPTFTEFLRYLTDPTTRNIHTNEHWQTFHELCQPCSISYDMIGSVETMADDASTIVAAIQSSYQFPPKNTTTDDYVADMFASVPDVLLNRIRRYYQDDIEAFGYDC